MSTTKIVVYSATGNTYYVASQFENADVYLVHEVLENPSLLDGCESLGLFFPIYYFSVPYIMSEFIKTVIAERDNTDLKYIFSVATYGGGKGITFTHLENLLAGAGCALSYSNLITLPDAYLTTGDFDKEKDLKLFSDAKEVIEKIKKDVENEVYLVRRRIPLVRLLSSITNKLNLPKKKDELTVNDDCTKCLICTTSCPMNNISLIEDKITFADKCVSCFACYHFCPERAICFRDKNVKYENPMIDFKGRYK